MSVSTNGIIRYGVVCEEGAEFPWDNEKYDYDIEIWWLEINDYKPLYKPFTEEGEYAEGWASRDPRFDEYFDHKSEWLKNNPIPVDIENYCSDGCPMYAIIVPEIGLRCSRGYPESFDPLNLTVTEKQKTELLEFLEKYNIEYETEPSWLLMSYWG